MCHLILAACYQLTQSVLIIDLALDSRLDSWTGLWIKIWTDVQLHIDYFLMKIIAKLQQSFATRYVTIDINIVCMLHFS